jgi:hypothetical protein
LFLEFLSFVCFHTVLSNPLILDLWVRFELRGSLKISNLRAVERVKIPRRPG